MTTIHNLGSTVDVTLRYVYVHVNRILYSNMMYTYKNVNLK